MEGIDASLTWSSVYYFFRIGLESWGRGVCPDLGVMSEVTLLTWHGTRFRWRWRHYSRPKAENVVISA